MKINSTTNTGPIGPPVGPVSKPTRVKSQDDGTSFQQTEVLRGALADTPSVRPEVVARAQQLINDNQYPPTSVVDSISNLFAEALQGR